MNSMKFDSDHDLLPPYLSAQDQRNGEALVTADRLADLAIQHCRGLLLSSLTLVIDFKYSVTCLLFFIELRYPPAG